MSALPLLLRMSIALLSVSAAASAQTSPAPSAPLTVTLDAVVTGVTVGGTATITPSDTGVTIAVTVTGARPGEQEVNLVHGTCGHIGDVAQALTPLRNLQSTSTATISMDELLAGPYAIDVLRSAYGYEPKATHPDLVCGNIVKKK
jgi:hypothetical protein